MKCNLLVSVVVIALTTASARPEELSIKLFNGKDLTGTSPPESNRRLGKTDRSMEHHECHVQSQRDHR